MFTADEELSRSLTRSYTLSTHNLASESESKPYLVGIAGGTASGKTSLAKIVVSQLEKKSVLLLSLDSFYRPLTDDEKKKLESGEGINFDVPTAFDLPLLLKTLHTLVALRQPVKIPVYDFVVSDRVDWEEVKPAEVIIIEVTIISFRSFVD